VLIGSTEKMGVGTNVQDRAIALHHLDAPWRPADVAQREGRIIRQGNLNPEVQILRYVTRASFDGYMWQALQRKAAFISQVMHGRLDAREIGDIGDTALSFSEVKALATGNPLLMDKAEADTNLARLRRAERAYHRNQDALRHAVTRHERDIARLNRLAEDIDTAIGRRQDTRGEKFTMTVDGRHHAKRTDAGQHLKDLLQDEAALAGAIEQRTVRPGHLGGFPVTGQIASSLGQASITLALDGAPGTEVKMSVRDLHEADPASMVVRLENRLRRLEERKANAHADAQRARSEITHARESIGQPFPQVTQLAQARDRAREIDEQLARMAQPAQPPERPAAEAVPAQHGSAKPAGPPTLTRQTGTSLRPITPAARSRTGRDDAAPAVERHCERPLQSASRQSESGPRDIEFEAGQ
jgi:hypothetical protein